MTKEEWKQAEEKLNSAFSRVDLLVDGYAVTIRKEPCDKMRLGLTVYVDGTIKGEWVVQDCEIRRKFYYCSERSLLTAKERKSCKRNGKQFGKPCLQERLIRYSHRFSIPSAR